MWNTWEQLRRVTLSTLIVGKTIALLVSLGTCIVRAQSVRVNFALAYTKRLFNISAEAIIDASITHLSARYALILLKVKKIPFSDVWLRELHLEESSKSFHDVIGDVYWSGKYCFNKEKYESFEGYVTTPKSIYGCGKCGAWFFVRRVPFTLHGPVKSTKTDKIRFSCGKKNQIFTQTIFPSILYHLNELNIERMTSVWTATCKKLWEMYII